MPFADAMDLTEEFKARPPRHVLELLQAVRAGAWVPAADDESPDSLDSWPRGPVKGA